MFKKEFYNIKNITLLSLIAALYVALSLILAPISFGIVQFRLAEFLVLLCFYKKEFSISLVIGCFITNLFSPFGLDILFGTLHTLVSVIFIANSKKLFIASLWPSVFSFIVGFELYLYGEPLIISTLGVLVGEFVVVTVLGVLLFSSLNKSRQFKEFMYRSFKSKK